MRAILLPQIAPIEDEPLEEVELAVPVPKEDEVLVKVAACGLCHTDLDEIEGRLTPSQLPVVPGHQIVGTVVDKGAAVTKHMTGARVGITWLHSSCGRCSFCQSGRENLCDRAKWTGKDVNGGYAEYAVVGQDYAYPIPSAFSDSQAAPLLCAGVIGYRAIRLSDIVNGQTVGLFGFGASAHIAIQVVKHRFPNCEVFVVTRGQDHKDLAKQLGASWTGSPGEAIGTKLDRAIDFTPVGEAVRDALKGLNKGGRLVINAIRKATPLPEMAYHEHLWDEKEIKSVANVTRADAEAFFPIAAEIPIVPTVREFAGDRVNEALTLLKQGRLEAAGVLRF